MPIKVRWASATHVGCVRSLNQDAILAGPVTFAVADGMGGHAAGEVASALAIARVAQLPSKPTESDVLAALVDANARIRAEARPGSGREGMGTTIAGLALAAHAGTDGVLVFNVGDSRAYRMSEGSLRQVSVDHSLVAEMVTNGELDAHEARTHPSRNVVTRALGIDDEVAVDRWWMTPVPSDRYLVCSDGLTNEVDEAVIADLLASIEEPQAAVDQMLALALDAGARDNVSVVLVQIEQVVAGSQSVDDDTNPRVAVGGDGSPASDGDAGPSAIDPAVGVALITGVPSDLTATNNLVVA